MQHLGARLSLVVLLCLVAGTAVAAAFRVTVDGSSPFATLDQAVMEAANGDTILVGPGHHRSDDLCLEKDLTFISIAGRERTVIDGQDKYRLIVIDAPVHVVFEDLTFAHGWMASEDAAGGAMLIWSGAHVEVRDCSFEDNAVAWQAGAIHARGEGTVVEISDSRFLRNRAVQGDGACGVQMGGVMRIDNSCSWRIQPIGSRRRCRAGAGATWRSRTRSSCATRPPVGRWLPKKLHW